MSERRHRFRGHFLAADSQFAVTPLQDVFDQFWNVLRSFAQRGDSHRKDVESIVEVRPEQPVLDPLLQVPVGRGEHPQVRGDQLVSADALELLLLQHAQQLTL